MITDVMAPKPDDNKDIFKNAKSIDSLLEEFMQDIRKIDPTIEFKLPPNGDTTSKYPSWNCIKEKVYTFFNYFGIDFYELEFQRDFNKATRIQQEVNKSINEVEKTKKSSEKYCSTLKRCEELRELYAAQILHLIKSSEPSIYNENMVKMLEQTVSIIDNEATLQVRELKRHHNICKNIYQGILGKSELFSVYFSKLLTNYPKHPVVIAETICKQS